MAMKPTDTGPWATDANYPMDAKPEEGTPTKVLPDEEEDVGWRPGKKPPAQKMNRWQYLMHTWMEYLDDGDLSGNHTIAGDLDVNGDLDCDSLAVTADAAVGDDLEVGGDASVGGDLEVADQIYHGDITVTLSATAGAIVAGTWNYDTGTTDYPRMNIGNNSTVFLPIHMAVGRRLKRVDVYDDGAVSPNVALDIVQAGADVPHSESIVGSDIRLTVTTPAAITDDGPTGMYWLKIESDGTGSRDVYTYAITYDYPPP